MAAAAAVPVVTVWQMAVSTPVLQQVQPKHFLGDQQLSFYEKRQRIRSPMREQNHRVSWVVLFLVPSLEKRRSPAEG